MASIGVLPLRGSDDLTLPVGTLEDVWKQTLRVIDQIRTGPHMLSSGLKQAMLNVRFHATCALELLDRHQREAGGTAARRDSGMELPGSFLATVRNYKRSLALAKQEWNAWIDGAAFARLPALDGLSALNGPTEDAAQAVLDAAKPPSLGVVLGTLGIGLGVAGLIYLMK